jgi:hypothetical protein
MATKANFAPAEWRKLMQAPLLAGFAVSAADPSNFVGLLQEAFATARALSEARTQEGGDELVKAVASDLLTSGGRADAREGVRTIAQGAELDEIKDRALAALKETAALVESKAPADATRFKEWLVHVARTVAEAGLEDTFLGFGGLRMSDKEKATLGEISVVLGLEAAPDENPV